MIELKARDELTKSDQSKKKKPMQKAVSDIYTYNKLIAVVKEHDRRN